MTQTNQPVIEFMKTRRSVPAKQMAGPGPSMDEIQAMVEIASRVPDHGKLSPWRFALYGKKACERLNREVAARAAVRFPDMNEEMKAVEASRFSRAPTIIGIISKTVDHPKVPEWEQVLSAGAAAMNLLIAANAHGYDAQWITEWVAFDETLREPLGLQEGEKLAGFIYIGTRTMPKAERERPQISKVFTIIED